VMGAVAAGATVIYRILEARAGDTSAKPRTLPVN